MKLLFILALVFNTILLASSQRVYDACDNLSLRWITYTNYYGPRTAYGLIARCPKGGPERTAGIDNCLANDDGNLKYEAVYAGISGAMFSQSCWDCVIEANSAWLNCACQNKAGGVGRTRIDLHYHVSFNSGTGHLTCHPWA